MDTDFLQSFAVTDIAATNDFVYITFFHEQVEFLIHSYMLKVIIKTQ